jgi:Tfp pilus assembly protein PilO
MARFCSEHTWRVDLAAVAVLVGLTLALAVAPAWVLVGRQQETDQVRDEVAVQRDLLNQLENELTRVNSELHAVEETAAQQAVQLDSSDAINAKLASLSDLAAEIGLQIDTIRPGQPQPGRYYQTVPLHLAGVGTYRQCAQFLRQLKTVMPDTSARAFDLEGNAIDPMASGTFRFELQWIAAVDTRPTEVAAP